VAQSLAGMLTRAGIATTGRDDPSSVYFSRAKPARVQHDAGRVGADTGEASSPLKALLATYDREKAYQSGLSGLFSSHWPW